MAGTKRPRDSGPGGVPQRTAPPSSSPYIPMFEGFRAELDEHHDRRERIVKASRDITALSKKIIFALQRTPSLPSHPLPPTILSATTPLQNQINALFSTVAFELFPSTSSSLGPPDSPQNINPNAYRYHHQYSPGIQEYIESLAFAHYLQHQRLITFTETAAALRVPASGSVQPPPSQRQSHETNYDGASASKDVESAPSSTTTYLQIPLTEADYLGGISDLVGEMMRFGITGMVTSGTLPGGLDPEDMDIDSPHADGEAQTQPRNILTDLRALRSAFEELVIPGASAVPAQTGRQGGRGGGGGGGWGGYGSVAGTMASKIGATRQSVEKVEFAAYGLVVRGSERPKGWVPEMRADEMGEREAEVEVY